MGLQDSIKKILREEVGFIEKMKNLFSKKEVNSKEINSEDKIVDHIVKFINTHYSMEGTRDEWGTVTIYLTNESGTIYPPIMKYYPDSKKLDYSWDFTQDIHKWFGDDRLLHLDSEVMGKIFEKLFKKKVNYVYGYSHL